MENCSNVFLPKHLPLLDAADFFNSRKMNKSQVSWQYVEMYMHSSRQSHCIKVDVFMLSTLRAKFLLSFCMQQNTQIYSQTWPWSVTQEDRLFAAKICESGLNCCQLWCNVILEEVMCSFSHLADT